MFLVQGFKDKPEFLRPVKVYEIKNDDREEALKNLAFVFSLKIFDQVTLTPSEDVLMW